MDPRLIALVLLANFASAEFAPQRFAYMLQAGHFAKDRAEAVRKLAASDRDLLIIDYSFWGDHDSRWTGKEIAAIRAGKSGRKVLAYLSIGEAGTYRYYWQKDASYLRKPNPNWPDNIRVAYWRDDWQAILRDYLAEILRQGFDGVWLDTVDTFEHFEHEPETDEWLDDRPNPATGNSYRDDMVALVRMIADSARVTRPDFLVVPNNGAQLLSRPAYLGTINAIGIEDLFAQKKAHRKYLREQLAPAFAAKLPVLLIEYKKPGPAARELRSPLLFTDRPLKTLGEAIWIE
jgi:cysteinyl-tRNA synthetase